MVHTKDFSDKKINAPVKVKHSVIKSKNNTLNKFEQFCARLIEDINNERTISPINMSNFSRITTYILRQNITPSCETFDELYRILNDYWMYEFASEDNYQRGGSYIQLYQMITMIKDSCTDLELKCRAHIADKSNTLDTDVIQAIYSSPGITFSELESALSMRSEILAERLEKLNRESLVVSRRTGKWQYYLLTDLGSTVYKELFSETYNVWADQWDTERIIVLALVLKRCAECGRNILVQSAINRVESLDNAQIAHYMELKEAQELKRCWLNESFIQHFDYYIYAETSTPHDKNMQVENVLFKEGE